MRIHTNVHGQTAFTFFNIHGECCGHHVIIPKSIRKCLYNAYTWCNGYTLAGIQIAFQCLLLSVCDKKFGKKAIWVANHVHTSRRHL